jgi:hypothetical protein
MRMHTIIHMVLHRININGPHMRPCGRILKQWLQLIRFPLDQKKHLESHKVPLESDRLIV